MSLPYTQEMLDSVKKVEATRDERLNTLPRRMTAEEKDDVLQKFHPDYKMDGFEILKMGPNKGEKAPVELAALLQGKSRLDGKEISLKDPDYDVDVLIIGGGGAGSSAAIEADEAGAKVMIVTKLRLGDANTMMAEGGIQAADKENDSPAQHYLDVMGGGHFANVPELVHKLVTEGPAAVNWLDHMGVMFDKDEDGRMVTTHGGGTSRKRMHAAKDYSGADIMRTLRDEVLNRRIPVVDFTAAVELIKDTEGKAAGAVLMNMETKFMLHVQKPSSLQPAVQDVCTIRDSRLPTIMEQLQTDWFWLIVLVPVFCIRIRCSIIRPVLHSRLRFSGRW